MRRVPVGIGFFHLQLRQQDYHDYHHNQREPQVQEIKHIDAGLGLGEGTGAVMLFSLLDLALALYEDQTTFDTMEIAQYERYGETE